jgi:hypothetical protein
MIILGWPICGSGMEFGVPLIKWSANYPGPHSPLSDNETGLVMDMFQLLCFCCVSVC